MNFLAHYFYDGKKESPYYNLGLLLPDLLRNFGRAMHVIPKGVVVQENVHIELIAGFNQHLASDKIFHSSVGFVWFNKQLIQALRNSPEVFNRDWFLAHVFTELMLDRVILMHNPSIASKLYEQLDLITEEQLLTFFRLTQYDDANQFLLGFTKFKEISYLQSYTKPESVAFAMGKIAQKMRINITSEGHKKVMMALIEAFENKMFTFMEDLSVELKTISG